MQFIRLPKPIDSAERVLPELVFELMNIKSVQNIDICFIQKLWVNMLISWVIKWWKCGMPHWHMYRHSTHRARAIWDLSNHRISWIIAHQCRQTRITLSGESICTIESRVGTSNVKIPEWGQHCFNHRMPYLVNILGTFRGTSDQPNEDPGAQFMCPADIIFNITNFEIQWPGMLIAWQIGQESLVGCTNDWHTHRSSRELILGIPPAIAHVHLTVYWAMFRVREVHCFKIVVCRKPEMCQKKLYTFENIPGVYCSRAMWMVLIELSSPSPKSSSARSFHTSSADWIHLTLKCSSPLLGCRSIHLFVLLLNDSRCWKLCADWNGCHGFHWSEFLQCLVYNPVALPYTFPSAFSTPTTCQYCTQWVPIRSLVLGPGWNQSGTVATSFMASINWTTLNPWFFVRFHNFANSELCLQLSIWVLIVSQCDIYAQDAVSHAVSPHALHFVIQSIFFELLPKMPNFRRYFTATQPM